MKKGAYYRYLNGIGWLYVLPAGLLYSGLMVYPILSSFWLVTQRQRGFNSQFIGLANFGRMLRDSIFHTSLLNNFLFMIVQIPLMILLALILAVILNQGIRRLRGVMRTLFFLPAVTSLVAYSVLFRTLLQTNGLLNTLFLNIGLIGEPVGWLNDPFWARMTIIVALTWRWTGYNMVFFLVGLQNIDSQIFEAAEVDGASKVRQFFTITVPLLIPVILFSAVTSTNGTLQLFDEPYILTNQGAPANATSTISLYIYRQMFDLNSDFGYAAALSYVVVLISGLLAWLQIRFLRERV